MPTPGGKRHRIRQGLALAIYCAFEIFSALQSEQLETVIDEAGAHAASVGEVIIRQGDTGDTFFVVASGTYTVAKDGDELRTYGEGEHFGELALLYNAPRAATVTCTEAGTVWMVQGPAFRAVAAEAGGKELALRARFLLQTPLLRSLTGSQRLGLAEHVQPAIARASRARVASARVLRRAEGGKSSHIPRWADGSARACVCRALKRAGRWWR
jgi:CRP-like cAMP-binding protein